MPIDDYACEAGGHFRGAERSIQDATTDCPSCSATKANQATRPISPGVLHPERGRLRGSGIRSLRFMGGVVGLLLWPSTGCFSWEIDGVTGGPGGQGSTTSNASSGAGGEGSTTSNAGGVGGEGPATSNGSGGAGGAGGQGVTTSSATDTTSGSTSSTGGGDTCVLDWGVDLTQVWAKRFGDEGGEGGEGGGSDEQQEGVRVALDASGEAFVAGVYASPLDLGLGLLPQAGYNGQGYFPAGMFVGRFDASGAPQYSVGVVSTELIYPADVTARTGTSSLFVFGQYLDQVDSWGLPDGSGSGNFFVAELDAAGNKTWAAPFTGGGYGDPGRMAYSSETNALYAAGTFQTSMTIGATTIFGSTGPVGYLVRLNPDDGTVAWSKTFDCGPSCPVGAPSVAVDDGGVVYGLVSLPSNAGCSCDVDTETIVPDGRKMVVLVGYDASGAPRGARTITGDDLNYGTGVATSGTDVFVLGSARGSVTPEGGAELPADPQNGSAYLASYDTLGGLRFATLLGGDGGVSANAMAPDAFGRLWITGAASSTVTDLGCPDPFAPGSGPLHPYLMAVDASDGHTVLANFLNVGASGYVAIYGLAAEGRRIALTGHMAWNAGPAQVDFGAAPLTSDKNAADVLTAVLEMP